MTPAKDILKQLEALARPGQLDGMARATRWVASGALRELQSEAVQQRLKAK